MHAMAQAQHESSRAVATFALLAFIFLSTIAALLSRRRLAPLSACLLTSSGTMQPAAFSLACEERV